MRKKAISDIVSTVLIIMISVAAVGIIASIVVPMIKTSLVGGQACMNAMSDISIQEDSTCKKLVNCVNSTNETDTKSPSEGKCGEGFEGRYNVSLVIYKGTDDSVNLDKIQISLLDSSGNSNPRELATEMTLGQSKLFTVGNVSENIIALDVIPILKVGNKPKYCDKLGKAALEVCA
jgi:hypothetical protein